LVDNKSNRPGTSELQDDRVYPGDVIGNEEAPAARKILDTERSYPIDQAGNAAGSKIKGALGGGISRHLFYVYNCSISLCNRVMTSERKSTATRALTLLLAINLFNYIDRKSVV